MEKGKWVRSYPSSDGYGKVIYLIISNGDSTTFFLSTIYGISAVCLALLMATVTISWCFLQFPVNLLGMILNLSESEYLSRLRSL